MPTIQELEEFFQEKEEALTSVATTDQSPKREQLSSSDHYTDEQIIGQILTLLNKVNGAREELGCGYMFEANAVHVSLSYNLVEDQNDVDKWAVHTIVREYLYQESPFKDACMKVYDALLKIAEMRGIEK